MFTKLNLIFPKLFWNWDSEGKNDQNLLDIRLLSIFDFLAVGFEKFLFFNL